MKKRATPEARLEQLLESLSTDLAQATDAELLEACADLGLKPEMKGSVALIGLKGKWIRFFPYVAEKLAPSPDPPVDLTDDEGPNLPRTH